MNENIYHGAKRLFLSAVNIALGEKVTEINGLFSYNRAIKKKEFKTEETYMKKTKFYICPTCRNTVEMIYVTDIKLFCCSSSECIACRKHNFFTLSSVICCHFPNCCCFTNTINSYNHNN